MDCKRFGAQNILLKEIHTVFSASQYNPKTALFAGDLNSKQTEVEANFYILIQMIAIFFYMKI